jgi:hypothetical protein
MCRAYMKLHGVGGFIPALPRWVQLAGYFGLDTPSLMHLE